MEKLSKVKYENGKLIVPTPKGNIVVTPNNCNSYPGVFIDFVSKDIKDDVKIVEDEITLALVEYSTADKELRTFTWEHDQERYAHKATHNSCLIFKDDYTILPRGLKVTIGLNNDSYAFIMDDDRDNCNEGYEAYLNYYIKYAKEGETFEDVNKRINENNEDWYDDMVLWRDVEPVLNNHSLMKLVDSKEKLEDFSTRLIEQYSMNEDDIKNPTDDDTLLNNVIETICFSYSDTLADFIYDNALFFEIYANEKSCDIENYIDSVLMENGHIEPFIYDCQYSANKCFMDVAFALVKFNNL